VFKSLPWNGPLSAAVSAIAGRGRRVAACAIPALLLVLVAGGSSAAARSRGCALAWRTSPTPDISGALEAVSASSSSDIWAVGGQFEGASWRPLIEHWDGRRWRHVAAPSVYFDATAVVALSPKSAWAVAGGRIFDRVFLRWDGSRWSAVPTKMVANDVTAAGGGKVWAVGSVGDERPSVELWNGSRWQVVAAPADVPSTFHTVDLEPDSLTGPPADRPVGGRLQAAASVGGGQTWAVGAAFDDRTRAWVTFTSRWDGKRWRYVPSAAAAMPSQFLSLRSVAGSSPTDVWGVGFDVVERWDGREWTVIAGALCDNCNASAVAAVSPADAWIVGSRGRLEVERPLILHWDGQAWQPVPAPRGNARAYLADIVALSSTDIWAVGSRGGLTADESKPVIVHYGCG
jgi:hypothetical protein